MCWEVGDVAGEVSSPPERPASWHPYPPCSSLLPRLTATTQVAMQKLGWVMVVSADEPPSPPLKLTTTPTPRPRSKNGCK